jgi:hypothetical protein
MTMSRIAWDGIFVEHPVRPVPVGDPLSNLAASMPQLDNESPTAVVPRIGYASFWEKIPQRTWSGSAWNLREGLRLCRSGGGSAVAAGAVDAVDDLTDGLPTTFSPSGLPMPEG